MSSSAFRWRAHNFDYLAQLLYDSSFDLGGAAAVAGLIRP